MSLTSGDRLGPYEIIQPIGAGGMGEVYRARDPRLGREVAIKVSAERFSDRFEREARAIASLNHPNICTLHDVGPDYLVMELVAGPTLAERIQEGPVALPEALAIARQIAAALEAAHEKGVVHRDLKPGNVKLKPDGTVKVLDFGLAKADAAGGIDPNGGESRTLTLGTQAGVILGTAAYMPPEQARGKPVDKRADIWAFGCVLYEMLAGRPVFDGPSVTDILAAVVMKEPDWSVLPPGSPHETLRRCLEKDPRRRLRDIGDALLEPESVAACAPARVSLWRQPVVIGLILLVLALAAGALIIWNRAATPSRTVSRFVIPLPDGQELSSYPAISRDGRTIAYAAKSAAGDSQLYLRDLNAFEAKPVAGSNGAWQPFFSPDGNWVAFFTHGQLLKAALAGGSPVKIADAHEAFGGTWTEDGSIIFPNALSSGLLRVPANGGKPESLTKPEFGGRGHGHILPQALPGGRNLLFTIMGQGAFGTAALSLDTRRWQTIAPGLSGVFVPSGHILADNENAELRAGRFHAAHPAATTADTLVLNDVYYENYTMRPWLAVSATGTLVYAPGNPAKLSLVWTERDGKTQPASPEHGHFRQLCLSPDGSKAAVEQDPDLWIYDLQRGSRTRLTFQGNVLGHAGSPVWSLDGKRIIFTSDAGGDFDIHSQPVDGSRPAEVLLKRPYHQFPNSVAPDGTIAFAESHPATGEDLWLLSPGGQAAPLLARQFYDSNARFSYDGRWVAYDSDESGRREVYVESYPSRSARVAVSSGGGTLPVWSHDSRELFYCSPDSLMSVAVRPDGSFGAPRRLFDRAGYFFEFHTYDVSPDGKRFLMIRREAGSIPRQLNVVLNWFNELK